MSAAVLFQNMPPLSREEYESLETSIREHGIQVPIVVDENRVVIDGHHRQKIAQELGIDCPKRVVFDKSDAEKRTLALSLNLDRRHLNREQRRALIAESIKADPQLPDLQHAKRTGASPTTVGTVRRDLEATGDVSNLETRTDSLGRQQPASKPRPVPPVFETTDVTGWDPDELHEQQVMDEETQAAYEVDLANVDKETGEIHDQPVRTPADMAGKTYTRPEPSRPKRRAITDQLFDAFYDLTKVTERIGRLSEDDRFPQNAEKVAAKHRSDLIRARDLLQEVINRLPSA